MKTENLKPFTHGILNADTEINVAIIAGYQTALNNVMQHISAVTNNAPENRYIDSVAILDRITLTFNELSAILARAQQNLQEDSKEEKQLTNMVQVAENFFDNLPRTNL